MESESGWRKGRDGGIVGVERPGHEILLLGYSYADSGVQSSTDNRGGYVVDLAGYIYDPKTLRVHPPSTILLKTEEWKISLFLRRKKMISKKRENFQVEKRLRKFEYIIQLLIFIIHFRIYFWKYLHPHFNWSNLRSQLKKVFTIIKLCIPFRRRWWKISGARESAISSKKKWWRETKVRIYYSTFDFYHFRIYFWKYLHPHFKWSTLRS